MSSFPPSVPPNPSQMQPSPTESFKAKASLAALIVCPILIALPPRKLDLYTFSLATGFILAANHQTEVRTGRSILLNIYAGRKEREEQKQRQKTWQQWEEDETGHRRLAKKVWTGDDKSSSWKEQRMKEEREIAEQGKGIGDVIVDQIKDVWRVDKKGDDEKKP